MNIRISIWICCERSPTARDFVYVRNLNVELKSLDGGGSARECGALSWGAGACAAWRWAECVSHVLRRLHARRSRQGARPVSLHKTKDKDRKCTGEKREASHERDAECAGRSTHRPQHAQAAARTSCSVRASVVVAIPCPVRFLDSHRSVPLFVGNARSDMTF